MTTIGAYGRLRISKTMHDHAVSDDVLTEDVSCGLASVVYCEKNLLINTGLQAFTRLLGGGVGAPLLGGGTFTDISQIVVSKMELGAMPSPPDPTITDTTGVAVGGGVDFYYVPYLTVTYPDDYTVRFSGVLPQSEGIGVLITGECLKLANGAIFAKKTFSQLKDGANALQFDHDVIIKRV